MTQNTYFELSTVETLGFICIRLSEYLEDMGFEYGLLACISLSIKVTIIFSTHSPFFRSFFSSFGYTRTCVDGQKESYHMFTRSQWSESHSTVLHRPVLHPVVRLEMQWTSV